MQLPLFWKRPAPWLLLGSLGLSALVVRPLAVELGAALVFGFVSERPVAWMLRRVHRDTARWRWAAATAFAVVVSLTLLIPAAFALWVAIREIGSLLATADASHLERALNGLAARLRARSTSLGVTLPAGEISSRARSLASSAGAAIARGTGSVLARTPGALFSAFVVLVGWVTFAVKGKAMRDRVLPMLLPWPREREIISRTTADVIDGVVLANIGVSVVQATIVLVATLALRVPNAVVWGVASFALSFVPLIGTAAVTLSAAAWLLLMGRTGAAVVMVVVAIIAGSVDNILRPMLARGASELSFLWMMVAFVGGVTVFGVPGVILGPLALAWATALWEALHLSDEPDLSDD
jgi:predicted PurR-regulated permease PerM